MGDGKWHGARKQESQEGEKQMNVITVTRQIGSWGDYIGVDVAKALDMRYIDREIITMAAERAGVTEETIKSLEEPKGLFKRITDSVLSMSPTPATASQALRQSDYYTFAASHEGIRKLMLDGFSRGEAVRHEVAMKFPEAQAFELTKTVVEEFAQKGNVVLAGSGSQMFLRDRPDVLHVLVVAPVEDRIKAIMEQEDVNRKVAERRVKENDEARASYIKHHYKVDWLNCSLYNLAIDTSRIPMELAVELVVKTAKGVS
jgi:cytidylate kinase